MTITKVVGAGIILSFVTGTSFWVFAQTPLAQTPLTEMPSPWVGRPLAGPTTSDCQMYTYPSGISAINCPTQYLSFSGAHTIGANDWGSTLVASGGSTVTFTLPSIGGSIGRNGIGFTTDGNTGFTIKVSAPAKMQGSSLIKDGMITAPPNTSGWIDYIGNNLYQVMMP